MDRTIKVFLDRFRRISFEDSPSKTNCQEKIIQFGEGNFLRAFVDWIVWKTNRVTDFNASVVVVKPTNRGNLDTLKAQNCQYHVNLQGLSGGKQVDSIELIDVISRGVNPYTEFSDYIALAEKPEMRFVISNTTEAGIAFDPDCRFTDEPALSFPGKLVQLLHHRYEFFKGDVSKGFIILPCELIFENGRHLKKTIHEYIDLWNLGDGFRQWFDKSCPVYNTLVDRIVPGYPHDTAAELTKRIGYEDKLLVKGEIFHLWVIEAPGSLSDEFPVDKAGLNVMFVPSEAPYHERKVTLLNGPHTVLSPVGYLSGIDTVRECLEDELIGEYVHKVIYDELIGTLDLPMDELVKFADEVRERFLNPHVSHLLTSIMLNSFPKFCTRNLPGIKKYYARRGELPTGLLLGLAAICTYYKGGKRGDDQIMISDNPSITALLESLWNTGDVAKVASGVLGASDLIWGEDLNGIPGMTAMLTEYLELIQKEGMRAAVKSIL